MVTEAQAQRSPMQSFTERFEYFFVPGVLVLVGLLLLAWVVVDEPFAASFYRAMAVLVAASPCALYELIKAVVMRAPRTVHSGVWLKNMCDLLFSSSLSGGHRKESRLSRGRIV